MLLSVSNIARRFSIRTKSEQICGDNALARNVLRGLSRGAGRRVRLQKNALQVLNDENAKLNRSPSAAQKGGRRAGDAELPLPFSMLLYGGYGYEN